MIILLLLIIIVAIALPSINKHISPVLFTRISSIVFIYAASLLFNIEVYIQSIGSGIGIYSGLFHITVVYQLFNLKLFLWFSILILTLLIIYISKLGYLGKGLKKYCEISSLRELFLLFFIISGIIMLFINLLLIIINYFNINYNIDYICSVNDTTTTNMNVNNTQDPVRWWPSGTAQNWGIIGTAVGVFRLTPGSQRTKVVAALGSLAISVPVVVYTHAVENPNGFNKLMYSWLTYYETGKWPLLFPNQISNNQIESMVDNHPPLREAKMEVINKSSSSFLPDKNDIFENLIPDNIIRYILDLFRPIPVEGYLDDLIGQQLFIHFLLLIVVIGLIILFSLFIFINIITQNKEFILKRFNNKLILFYIKYQIILSKISLIILPLFIFLGLIELLVGIHFLITHPIPYNQLDIDLHTFIKKD